MHPITTTGRRPLGRGPVPRNRFLTTVQRGCRWVALVVFAAFAACASRPPVFDAVPVSAPLGAHDVVVQIQGVRVQPGDWLVADADGIVVLVAGA